MSMMKDAMSAASCRPSGKFGIVACGSNRNDVIISELTSCRAAMAANGGARWNLVGAVPVA
jgi:hypothetical protein